MRLLAHEMTHVVQQEASGSAHSGRSATPALVRIQRQPAKQRATPLQQPLGPDAERIVATARDEKRDLKSRAVKLVYDILNTYFPGYSSKIAGVGYDDKKAGNERLGTEIKQTKDKDPGKPYGFIWVGHVLVEEAIKDPGGTVTLSEIACDVKALIRSVELCREIGNSAVLSPFVKREVMPGNLAGDALESFVRDATSAFWHQTCTAKMGRDEMSVVDGKLQVYGIDNLRIADGSIMPRVTTGNTMASCVIIGERAAELIGQTYQI